MEPVTWSMLGSDIYICDRVEVPLEDFVSYNLTDLSVAEWLHQEAYPNAASGGRYVAELAFYGSIGFLSVKDTMGPGAPDPARPSKMEVVWYRFALQQVGTVPAWRQSLFGAATLMMTHPSAAVVLVAAGFESFFIETMRIAWCERNLDPAAFDRLNSRNMPITGLVDWLPAAVGRPCLREAPGDLYRRWKELVNERRNDVVHRAEVHVTTEVAMASMRAALECMTFLDEAALTRPHSYYRPRPGSQAIASPED
jgi:hypothetical protein